MKNVLVACEYSGTVRDAFENAGWNAWSCDLLPTESEQTKASGKHCKADVLEVLYENHRLFYEDEIEQSGIPIDEWDLLIAHPPCTYLSYAGNASWNEKGRVYRRLDALKFFADLWEASVEHICIENPLGCASPTIAKFSQIIQPYQFGDPYTKRTCLWLKNLPLLESRGMEVEPTHNFYNANNCRAKKPTICAAFSSGKERSKFHKCIANAMAEQWTKFFEQQNNYGN